MQAQQRSSDEYRRGSLIPAASAAAALAQLHYHRGAGADADWAGDNMGQVIFPSLQLSPTGTEADFLQNYFADQNNDMKTNHFHVDPALEEPPFMQDHNFPTSSNQNLPALMASSLAHSPTDRPMTLPSLHRSLSRSHTRPRKSSLGQQARLPKHERKRSKDLSKRLSGERRPNSSEPSAASIYGKRWEDLIDAATSATEEEGSRDLTPIPGSPYHSPQVASRTSIPPPFALGSQFQSFQASPLNRALTPPPANADLDLQQYTSADSSLSSASLHHHQDSTGSGSQFNIIQPGTMDSNNTSPMFPIQQPVQIYCAGSSPRQGLSPRDWHNVRLERKSPIERHRFSCLTPANVHQITVETPHLRHIRGEDNLSAYATAKTINTGNTMTSSFCKTCGALMYRRSSGFPGLSFCRIGTVDETELHDEVLKPMAEQFTVSRAKWLEPVEGVRQTEGMSTE
ncbi:hypothetical protein B0A48_03164 [Cryoendolithus antarcticus]|uniref:CENP-V/GFA domain-containing protein n=1 Tax=Cryoendolithus antarcticus TaxID=1507870 RepID=A0A1V8TMS4_9PEZI|nr:hypothetical protein B0A48_03164 [Cryoendolithus antarcticus]